ncbi:pyridoxamine 5'-phosphate oxidase family protein [Actinomadura sp. NTSP31]|uniref:pyridoxamine 5'-phosphate oxidase family protein n=1 Tax=Actinomadura sp. NTSP31 TaxID=1735447 RepID=UPI0035BFB155
MTDREPIDVSDLDIYDSGGPMPWERARTALAKGLPRMETPAFLGTVRPDGRPHSAGIGALWHDGDLYFTSGPGTRKSRNLAENPACTLSARLEGLDLILEGEAARVTDPAVLEPVAAAYREGGWPAQVDGDAFTAPYSAQSAGPPPWHVFRFTVHAAIGVAFVEPYAATRWTFTV